MSMQLPDFPRWLRGLFAVFLILFFFNALYALAFFTAIWGLRIDPGVAILIGAIAGLGIVGWQARLGFANLIRSQEHRAAIEMEARNQQHLLDRQLKEQRSAEELRVLMAALRAEIVGLMAQAHSTMEYSQTMHRAAQALIGAKARNATKSLRLPTFNAPVYHANISRIGLLGASLAGDVVRVMAKTGTVPPATFDQPISNEVLAEMHDGLVDQMREWSEDLSHVALRIRAREEDTLDPGTLVEAQSTRQQEKAKKEKAAE